ncbi:TolC family protein [Plebeiibacterium marinum]|uniref:TolC family protein n=1 Tax=Plebeiibacterium marinum TaxID=2992111 RepID=A0AAE3SIA8_9BACT|nr:TolC family protein [Plebeiobacterium marinum]MCW3804530.1 TolC family protein [Plebeiobacterium marinum]
MRLKKYKLACFMWLIFSAALSAQEKHIMDLNQMLEFARQNNYEIKEANLYKMQSQAKVKEVKGNGLPQIKSEVDYKHYIERPVTVLDGATLGRSGDILLPVGRIDNVDASVQFSQLLFSLKYINGVKTAKKVTEIRDLEVDKAEEEMIQLLLNEYYNLLAIYANLNIIESNMESLAQMKHKISSLVTNGVALKTDLDKITVNYANLQANKEQVLAAINVQSNNLKYIIGIEPNDELAIDTTGFHNLFKASLITENTQENLTFDNLTEVQMLNKSLDLYNLKVKTEQAEKYPNVALYGSFMYQGMRNEFNFFDTNEKWYPVQVVGFKASIPIFTGFSNNAKIKQAKYDYCVTQNKMQKALSGLQLQYSNALMQYNASVRNCQIQIDNIQLAKDVRHQEEMKYNEGMSTLTDLLISEKDLRTAEINYAQNFITMKQAEVDLLKSKGLLKDYLVSHP